MDGVLIESKAKGIKSNAISGKQNLEVALLASVSGAIEPNAFSNCSNLVEVMLPAK